MAGKDAVVSTSPQFRISRHQYDALLASHKAFHDVAIRVTDILQDPSRTSYYQSVPSEAEGDVDANYNGQNVPKNDGSVSRQQSGGAWNYSKRYTPHQEERKPAQDETITSIAFEVENTKARKAYSQKRQRSINFYASTSLSYLDTEYDFQCMLIS